MNPYQSQLYADLIALVKSNEAFYHQDFDLNDKKYRIFNYRLASYTEFLLPSALEARGVMFEVDREGQPLELMVLPMPKFFNAYENPMTMGIDFSQVDSIYLKLDGSLMSSYIEDSVLKLKSKGSISSEQCLAAMVWLDTQPTLHERIQNATMNGLTVCAEWCSPRHRIVIGYPTERLKVLCARSREDGSFVSYADLQDLFGIQNVVEKVETTDAVAFVGSIPGMTEVEGFVVHLASGQRVKIKCEWYLSLHHAKDSVNNPRRLFEAILDEGIDDLRSLFHADVVAMMIIDQMQEKVDHIYNGMVKAVEAYYEANKGLTRKDYAIKGQAELLRLYFGVAMDLYTGRKVNYKAFLKSKWKDLGLKDTSMEDDNEQ